MNHRHADFQSPREEPKTRVYRKKTVKPNIESQSLSGDLSNSQERHEADRAALFPSKPSVDTLDMFAEAGVSDASRRVRGKTSQDDYIRCTIRLPQSTYVALQIAVQQNNRSPNAEIIHRLQASLDRPSVALGALPQERGDEISPPSFPTTCDVDRVTETFTLSKTPLDSFKIDLVRLALDIHGQKVAQALWHEMGLPMPKPPPSRAPATSEATEIVSVFLIECTTPDPRWQMSATELHRCYERWMVGRDGPQLGLHAFGKVAIKCGAKRRRSNGSMYIGIRLRGESRSNG